MKKLFIITVLVLSCILSGCGKKTEEKKAEEEKIKTVRLDLDKKENEETTDLEKENVVKEANENKAEQKNTAKEQSTTPNSTANTTKTDTKKETVQDTPSTKETGDYIGTIASPLPPKDGTYRISRNPDCSDYIVIHVTNYDAANFRFYLTKAFPNPDPENFFKEALIFREHIAHYNGNGYYEYKGKDYHLYFRYTVEQNEVELPANHHLEVYGLDKLFRASDYSDSISYNGISGNMFIYGAPFAG